MHVDTPLWQIAELLERRRIKRVPVMRDGKVVGIVSRANLLQALVAQRESMDNVPSVSDRDLRSSLLEVLQGQAWCDLSHMNVMVKDGVPPITGATLNLRKPERPSWLQRAVIPGIRDVVDHTHKTVTIY